MEHDIATVETEIANKIKALPEKKSADGEPSPAPSVKKEEKSGIGWLIFGGVVFAITLGAVSVFKKK